MSYFAVTYVYGPAEIQDLHRPAHRQYLSGLFEQGKLAASGPLTDEGSPNALLIFIAEAASEVEELIAADPMKLGGAVLAHDIRAWNPVIGKVGK